MSPLAPLNTVKKMHTMKTMTLLACAAHTHTTPHTHELFTGVVSIIQPLDVALVGLVIFRLDRILSASPLWRDTW